MPHLAIIRGSSKPINVNQYNVQEIGLAKSLSKFGWSVDIFARFEFSRKDVIISQKGNQHVTLFALNGVDLPFNQGFYPTVFQQLLKKKYDVIQVNDDTNIMSHLVSIFVKNKSCKTVLWQGMYLKFSGWKGIIQKIFNLTLNKKFFNYIDLPCAKTSIAKRHLLLQKHKAPKILHVGLDVNRFENIYKTEKKIISFSKNHHPTLLYIGSIEPRRNLGFLISVLSKLKKKYPNAGMLLVGDGPDVNSIKSKVNESLLNDDVLFCGTLPQKSLPGIYKSADLFMLPSKYEIFGMVILEALYFGLPVIASKQAGPLEIIKNPVLGNCLDLNSGLWVNAIEKNLKKNKKNFLLRKTYIIENYNWDIIAKQYSITLTNLIMHT